jgi:hypothetical protein
MPLPFTIFMLISNLPYNTVFFEYTSAPLYVFWAQRGVNNNSMLMLIIIFLKSIALRIVLTGFIVYFFFSDR